VWWVPQAKYIPKPVARIKIFTPLPGRQARSGRPQVVMHIDFYENASAEQLVKVVEQVLKRYEEHKLEMDVQVAAELLAGKRVSR
jgi:endonuclease IV